MVKKILLIILVIACLVGVGILGYVVFNSKNITAVEIEGQIQTLYMVDETTTPNYGEAKLKVTYKNGNAKFIDLTSKSVKVSDFSTSVGAHGNMKLTYKSYTLEVEYNVIKYGFYYVQESTVHSGANSQTTGIDSIGKANKLFFLDAGGALKYYWKGYENNWFLNDGVYDADYSYSVAGDSLTINYGKNTEILKADFVNGDVVLSSVNDTVGSGGTVVTRTVNKYACFSGYKTNIEINKITDLYAVGETLNTFEKGKSIEFTLGRNLKSDNKEIYFKAEYSYPIITYNDTSGKAQNMLGEVYVRLTDNMVNFDTTDFRNTPATTCLFYENYSAAQGTKTYEIYYTVKSAV